MYTYVAGKSDRKCYGYSVSHQSTDKQVDITISKNQALQILV